jgi:protein-tyrosine-phosphatase
MAMGLLRAKVRPEAGEWRIESAGVWAGIGNPAAENTRLLVERVGIDISDHRSRPVTRELLQEFNLILTMEIGQKEALRAAFPEQVSKIYLLREMVGEIGDVVDPIGGPLVDFQAMAREINHVLTRGYRKIRALADDLSYKHDGQSS